MTDLSLVYESAKEAKCLSALAWLDQLTAE
jgi:hypothetical protein